MPNSPAALALTAVLLLGLVVPTGASSGDHLWADPAVVVAPGTGPGGDYARLTGTGELEVDVTAPGINADAVTVFEGVFTVENRGDEAVAIWFSHDALDDVVLAVEGTNAQREADPLVLDPGEQASVDLTVDTAGRPAGDLVLEAFTVHAEEPSADVGVTPSSTTTTDPTGDAPPTEPVATTTSTPEGPTTPERTPTPREPVPSGDDRVVFADGVDPATTVTTLDPARAMTLDASAGFVGPPRARIDADLAPTALGGVDVAHRVDAAAVVTVGQRVTLSGHRTGFDSVRAIQPDGRVARLVEIDVPADRVDEPARVHLAVDRAALGGADPTEARIGRLADEGWQLLATSVVEADDERVVLEAPTPGFSAFAVFPAPAVEYDWRLANGATSRAATTETRFDEAGPHTVTLTVTDAQGRTSTTEYDLLANDRPSVAIEAPATIEPGEPVTLRANVTDRVGETTVTWQFADGTTVVGTSVERSFPAGDHRVRVVVADEHGATAAASTTLAVGDAARTTRAALQLVRLGLAVEDRLVLAAVALLLLLAALRRARAGPKRSRRREGR